jgi:lipopolysaccharide/colanic/teichoic acid biosynthesis glycosyltransferase
MSTATSSSLNSTRDLVSTISASQLATLEFILDEQELLEALQELDVVMPEHETDLPLNPIKLSYLHSPHKDKPLQWFCKRAFDVLFTSVGIITFSIPLLTLAALVKFTSEGGLFFTQERIGLHGKKFKMYKFRSMYVDAEDRLKELLAGNETNQAMFKMKNDPRVTPVGKWLRKFSLDEFPQLLNVLKGEMSLVGPRPPIERELSAYETWHYVRFSTVPGLTGAWQVSGRSNIKEFNDVVKLDFNYIRNWSVWQDLVILFKTVPVVLLAKGSA